MRFKLIFISILFFLISGCAATQMVINHRNLAVQSQMSDTIFLDTEQFKRYRTRIVSMANKVNLKYETALPSLQASLSKCIAGIF